jgi:copper transport protein
MCCASSAVAAPGTPGRDVSRLVQALSVAALLFAGTVGVAFGHASLLQSTPVDGSVLATAPQTFLLTFSEPVSPIFMRLVDTDGTGSDLTGVDARNDTVQIVAPAIRNGTHALSWRVISADGHPVGGSIIFSVGAANGTIAATGTISPALAALIWLTRVAVYLGLFVGVGGRFFGAWIASRLPDAAERLLAGALGLGLVAAVVSPGLQGLDVLGLDLSRLFEGATWFAGVDTSYATTLAIAAASMLVALLAGRLRRASARFLAAIALLGIGAALAASGHASTAPPELLTRPAIFIHGVCVAFWVGSLIPLAALMRCGDPAETVALARFSRVIPYPLACLVLTGATLAVIQLGSVSALWTTSYGLVFDAKLAGVVLLLAIAAWNRFRLTAAVAANRSTAGRTMARSIALEVAIVAVILGLVAMWRFTPPPRAAAAPRAVPIHIHIWDRSAAADLTVSPGRAGPSSIEIAILDGHFGQLPAQGVTLVLANPSAGVEPIHREARHIDGANWAVDVLTIPASGHWTAKLDILVSDFDEVTIEGAFDLP